MHVNGHRIDVDIRAELERYTWHRPRWTNDKLIAASPFRYDSTPSFFVSLEHGGWADSGAIDPEYTSGGFVKLLAFLDNMTEGEAADYLIATYGFVGSSDDHESHTLSIPQLGARGSPRKALDNGVLAPYCYRHPYLSGRGISEAVQRLMCVGYDRKRNAVTMPWRSPSGALLNVKYRRVDSKIFWYERDAWPIREILYAIDVIYTRQIRRAAIVEAEIDALTLMSAGVPAIATGGSGNFNHTKAEMIARSPLEEIVIFADHDAAGQAMKRKVAEILRNSGVRVLVAGYPKRYKDVNEYALSAGLEAVKKRYEAARPIRLSLCRGMSNYKMLV